MHKVDSIEICQTKQPLLCLPLILIQFVLYLIFTIYKPSDEMRFVGNEI